MSYKVLFPSKSTEKKFERSLEDIFPASQRTEIYRKIKNLAKEPRPHGNPKIRPPVHIYNFAAQYRLRVGDFRILYDVDDSKKIVWILALKKRNENTYL